MEEVYSQPLCHAILVILYLAPILDGIAAAGDKAVLLYATQPDRAFRYHTL